MLFNILFLSFAFRHKNSWFISFFELRAGEFLAPLLSIVNVGGDLFIYFLYLHSYPLQILKCGRVSIRVHTPSIYFENKELDSQIDK